MPATDKLFQLIKSLSRSEKRNFSLFSQLLQGEKEYLKLFHAIDNQKDYDEKAIRDELQGARMLNQLSVAKNYLYGLITKTLQVFSKKESVLYHNNITQISLLADKGLYSHAEKLARKACLESERAERFNEWLFLLDLNRNFLHKMNKSAEFQSFIKEIQEEELKVLALQRNLLEYQHLHDEVTLLVHKNTLNRAKKDISVFKSIFEDPLIQNETNALSKRARMYRFLCLKNIYWYSGKPKESFKSIEALIQIFETSPFLKTDYNRIFIQEVSNGAMLLAKERKLEEALAWIKKLEDEVGGNEEEAAAYFEKFAALKILLGLTLGDFEMAGSAVTFAERGIEKYEGNFSQASIMVLYHSLAHYYFEIKDSRKCIHWLQMILNQQGNEMRMDLQCICRIMHLAALFQQNSFESIEYYIRSYTRFIYKRENLEEYEKMALSFFRDSISFGLNSSRQKKLADWAQAFRDWEDKNQESMLPSYFSMVRFLEAEAREISVQALREASRVTIR